MHGHLRVAATGMSAAGEARRGRGIAARDDGAPEVPRHPLRGGICRRGAGRRVAAASREAQPLEMKMPLNGRAARPGSGGSFRVGAEDGEILKPVETGEAIIQEGKVRAGGLILWERCQPFLPKFIGDVRTRQKRHPDCVEAVKRSSKGTQSLVLSWRQS